MELAPDRFHDFLRREVETRRVGRQERKRLDRRRMKENERLDCVVSDRNDRILNQRLGRA